MLYTKLKSTIYVRRTCLEVISILTPSSDIFLPKLSKAYTYITYSGPLQFTHDSPYLWSNASEGMMLHVLIFWGQIKCIKFGDIFSIFFWGHSWSFFGDKLNVYRIVCANSFEKKGLQNSRKFPKADGHNSLRSVPIKTSIKYVD